MSWASKYSGWHTRAKAHPSPNTFSPSRDTLAFAVSRTLFRGGGLSLALFTPNIAVDASGRVLEVDHSDFAGLKALAHKALELPKSDDSQNLWTVKQKRTDEPIDKLLVPEGSVELKSVSVSGYDKKHRELAEPVAGFSELPDVLWELFGLVEEAEKGHGEKEDKEVIEKVIAVLGKDNV